LNSKVEEVVAPPQPQIQSEEPKEEKASEPAPASAPAAQPTKTYVTNRTQFGSSHLSRGRGRRKKDDLSEVFTQTETESEVESGAGRVTRSSTLQKRLKAEAASVPTKMEKVAEEKENAVARPSESDSDTKAIPHFRRVRDIRILIRTEDEAKARKGRTAKDGRRQGGRGAEAEEGEAFRHGRIQGTGTSIFFLFRSASRSVHFVCSWQRSYNVQVKAPTKRATRGRRKQDAELMETDGEDSAASRKEKERKEQEEKEREEMEEKRKKEEEEERERKEKEERERLAREAEEKTRSVHYFFPYGCRCYSVFWHTILRRRWKQLSCDVELVVTGNSNANKS
jgi:translation initiation factor 4G